MEAQYELITRNLAEVIGKDEIKKIIVERPLKIYWGTAPTGAIHIGYLVPLLKIADFLDAGCEVTILLADLHAFLDAMKSSMEQLALRTQYYEIIIKELLLALKVDINKLKFVKGTDFQLTPKYTMDMYKMNSLLTVNNTKHAGAEVVKQSDNPIMTSLLYPVLQALDEEYLDVDVQFGGVDQRKILVFAADYLPKIGYKKRIHLMNALVPGLSTVALKCDVNKDENKEDNGANKEIDNKMSSSNEKSKINIVDTANQIKKKVNSAYCLEGDTNDNTLLVLLNKIIFPVLNRLNKPFVIQKPEKFGGGTTIYNKYEDVFTAFESKALHPADFKLGIYSVLSNFLEPIRLKFDEPELKVLIKKAYP
jgi:tyrosyl-tRNA synthetase